MLQKKELPTTKIPVTPTKTNATKEELPTTTTTKIPVTPTKTNVTKEELPTTIKKPIVENQTSGKTKTNATKQDNIQHTTIKEYYTIVQNKITSTTKTNATKEEIPTTTTTKTIPVTQQKQMLQNKNYQQQ